MKTSISHHQYQCGQHHYSSKKLPKVGDVYIFTRDYTDKIAAQVIRIETNIIYFAEILMQCLEEQDSSQSNSFFSTFRCRKLAPRQFKFKKVAGRKNTSLVTFFAHSHYFGTNGKVSIHQHNIEGLPWNGEEILETHYW
jgi:hypothetical protein